MRLKPSRQWLSSGRNRHTVNGRNNRKLFTDKSSRRLNAGYYPSKIGMEDEKKIRFFWFGDLKALSRTWSGGLYWWRCQCRCGGERQVKEKRLLAGLITACALCEKRRQMKGQR
jgi:hypothetical protein